MRTISSRKNTMEFFQKSEQKISVRKGIGFGAKTINKTPFFKKYV